MRRRRSTLEVRDRLVPRGHVNRVGTQSVNSNLILRNTTRQRPSSKTADNPKQNIQEAHHPNHSVLNLLSGLICLGDPLAKVESLWYEVDVLDVIDYIFLRGIQSSRVLDTNMKKNNTSLYV